MQKQGLDRELVHTQTGLDDLKESKVDAYVMAHGAFLDSQNPLYCGLEGVLPVMGPDSYAYAFNKGLASNTKVIDKLNWQLAQLNSNGKMQEMIVQARGANAT